MYTNIKKTALICALSISAMLLTTSAFAQMGGMPGGGLPGPGGNGSGSSSGGGGTGGGGGIGGAGGGNITSACVEFFGGLSNSEAWKATYNNILGGLTALIQPQGTVTCTAAQSLSGEWTLVNYSSLDQIALVPGTTLLSLAPPTSTNSSSGQSPFFTCTFDPLKKTSFVTFCNSKYLYGH